MVESIEKRSQNKIIVVDYGSGHRLKLVCGNNPANNLIMGVDEMSRSNKKVKRVKVILKDSELTCGDYNK